jgi:hypothetical protein
VTVNVRPAQLQWALTGIPVKVVNPAGRVVVTPETVAIHVRGTRDAMKSDPASFAASVDVGGLRPGNYQLPVRVDLPPRVAVARIEPSEVRVRIR